MRRRVNRVHLHRQELVGLRMRFESDVATNGDRHQGDLQVSAAPDHGPMSLMVTEFLGDLGRVGKLRISSHGLRWRHQRLMAPL
jgi:hypothetical protein